MHDSIWYLLAVFLHLLAIKGVMLGGMGGRGEISVI